jgi:serine/threonine protein phosphatase PrpC
MLAHWLDRGLGQILAPDENIAKQPKEDEANASFWQFVAPDPVWEASQHGLKKEDAASPRKELKRQGSVPPPSAFALSTPPGCPKEVVCQHCRHMTPVIVAPSTPDVHQITGNKAPLPPMEFMSPLEKGVLVAAKATAESMMSPKYRTELRNKVFRLCASSKPLQPKLLERLQKWLENDSSLLSSRCTSMGNLCPDGMTPLMATAFVNQVEAAKIIIAIDDTTKQHVDMQGRTALHIAAEYGQLNVLRLLQGNDTLGASAPVDLVGHTPLGRAVTSHQKPARRAQTQLQQALFSPGDRSISGKATPLKERVVMDNDGRQQQLPIGFSQMPGFRINMEDALSIHSWEGHALVGVCDGHGDAQQVSLLVAEQVKDVFLATESLPMDQRWIRTCLTLDTRVKESGIIGGSTGVWALINETSVVVVNVGDCRCILVQEEEEKILEQMVQQLRIEGVEETKEEPPPLEVEVGEVKVAEVPKEETPKKASDDSSPPKPPATKEGEVEFTDGGEQTSEAAATPAESDVVEDAAPAVSFSVKGLTTDHKPDLAWEQARIEKSGLTVVDETFYDEHGLKQTVAKIQLAEGHRMAVARAFGDFEYKSNPKLGPEDQAVCVIPDVRIHARTKKDMYLILACDGIWDVMSNEEAGEFVVKQVEKAVAADEADILPKVGDLLLEECLKLGSKDNMSVVIVALSGTSEKVALSGALGRKALDF